MMFASPRLRTVIGAGTTLAVVAAAGIGLATSSSAASARYVTTTAGTGDVTQTSVATGSITRKNTSVVSFAVDGTVKEVDLAVGDEVEAGDVLAVLNKGTLQLAVLNAEAAVARGRASLYSAQHPSGSGSGSSGGSGSPAGGTTAGGATAVTIDPLLLNEAASRVNLAVLAEADICRPAFGAILPRPEPTPTATPTSGASATVEPTAPATPTASAEPTPSPASTATPTADATPSPDAGSASEGAPAPTASPSQLAAVLDLADLTDDELQACANARAGVIAANANLQEVVAQLTGPRPGGTGGGSGEASFPSSGSGSSASSAVSASQVAAAKADLLEAEQELAEAEADLAAAELVAPISGTVGLVGLAEGDSASAGSVTIVGSGSAVVTFELPLATRQLVAVGRAVTVTPAGSTTALEGTVTAIATLETDGTSGSSPTYTTTVSVPDAEGRLASGARASVLIPVKSATSVLRVPVSAVTPTGTATGTVQVVDTASATTARSVQVTTGAVGGGWVQITDGLEAGTLVVLADNTADIPANQSNRRASAATSTATASASASVTPEPPAASAAPTPRASSTGR